MLDTQFANKMTGSAGWPRPSMIAPPARAPDHRHRRCRDGHTPLARRTARRCGHRPRRCRSARPNSLRTAHSGAASAASKRKDWHPGGFLVGAGRARIGLGHGARSATPPTAAPRTTCSASRPAAGLDTVRSRKSTTDRICRRPGAASDREFRAYASYAPRSFRDYARLMKTSPCATPACWPAAGAVSAAKACAQRPPARRLCNRPGLCRQADPRHQHARCACSAQ